MEWGGYPPFFEWYRNFIDGVRMEFAAPFNMAAYFLDHNIEAGRGDKIAVHWQGGTRTYQGVYDDANRFAHVLEGLGMRPEERVLLCLPNRYEFIPAWFGILKAGAVFTMVNPLLPAKDYAHYLNYTRARVAIVEAAGLDKLLPHIDAAPHLDALVVVGAETGQNLPEKCHRYEALMAEASAEHRTFEGHPDDIAGWLFTSGSTGFPKGAVHRHRDFVFNTEHYAKKVLGIREEDITLGVPKLFFGYATGTDLMFPFAVGASTVIFPGRSTPETLFDHIDAFKPTILTSVPTMIGKMERHPRAETSDLSSLRMVLSAGEALPAELYERWIARTGVEILDGIGSAEMFHIYISNRPGDVKLGSLGKIVPGYQAKIVDEAGQEVPTGQVGRLHITGGSTAIMYWGDRQKSVETFHGETCITADFFRRDEAGYFYYEGRSSDLIKAGGIWVSPLEVENCLLTHPAVAEVAVVGRCDGEGLVKPCAYVVLAAGYEGHDTLCAEIQKHAKANLAYYKYPRWVEFIASMPRNDRGKMDRKVVRAWAESA